MLRPRLKASVVVLALLSGTQASAKATAEPGKQGAAKSMAVTPEPAQPGASDWTTAKLSPLAREILAMHNAARAAVGSPPLRWNPGIASQEQSWAEVLAQRGTLDHRPREGRGNVRENLARVPANYTIEQTIARWLGEMRDFVPGIFPNVCKSGGDCGGVLHYTQMVWFDTTDIGCGEARSGGFVTVVCGYGPGGNKDGLAVGLPTDVAPNQTIRARPLGGDYGQVADFDADDEFWAASVGLIAQIAEDTRLELGAGLENYDEGAGFNGGVFWDPVAEVTVGAGATYVDLPPDEPEVDTKSEQPAGPKQAVYNPPQAPIATPSGGASPGPRPGAWYVGGDFNAMIVEDVDSDFAIGGGATIPGAELSSDYGFDEALFVGYDLGLPGYQDPVEMAPDAVDQPVLQPTSETFTKRAQKHPSTCDESLDQQACMSDRPSKKIAQPSPLGPDDEPFTWSGGAMDQWAEDQKRLQAGRTTSC